jgi:hypothetical protein
MIDSLILKLGASWCQGKCSTSNIGMEQQQTRNEAKLAIHASANYTFPCLVLTPYRAVAAVAGLSRSWYSKTDIEAAADRGVPSCCRHILF